MKFGRRVARGNTELSGFPLQINTYFFRAKPGSRMLASVGSRGLLLAAGGFY